MASLRYAIRGVISVAAAAWLFAAPTILAKDARTDKVRIVLSSALLPDKKVELTAPRQYVSSRHADEFRAGTLHTDSLYLVFRYSPQSASPVSAASPRELAVGAPGLTHVFLNFPYRAASPDIGQWTLDTYIRDAKRAQGYRDPEKIDPGVLKYEFGGASKETVITYKDANSRTVAVKCRVRTCRGRKTWNSGVHVSYWYVRTEQEGIDVKHPREVDAFIGKLLPDTRKTSHQIQANTPLALAPVSSGRER